MAKLERYKGKSPGMKKLLERVVLYKEGCPTCGEPTGNTEDFRDDLSCREYEISGMCQKCQDGIFRTGDNEP